MVYDRGGNNMKEIMSASKLEEYISLLESMNIGTRYFSKKVNEKINDLYDLLEKIKSMGDDDLKVLYFPVTRGDITQYGDYKDLRNLGLVKDFSDFEEAFDGEYPDSVYWYRLACKKCGNYRVISLNFKNLISADISEYDEMSFWEYDYLPLLNFLCDKVKWCLGLLMYDEYNNYIEDNLPYRNRFGVIKRYDYWKVYPELKRDLIERISFKEIDDFVHDSFDKPSNRISNMTVGTYFDYCKKSYSSIGYNVFHMDAREAYLKYSDGRDEGLCELDLNDSLEFDKWYENENRYGGHPYEIISGLPYSRVNLYIEKDDGYFLGLNGRNILKNIEIAKIYLRLKGEVPIYLYNGDVVRKSFLGMDYIGVVPNYLSLIRNNGYFDDYDPLEFMYLNDDIFRYVKWQEIEKAYLK